MSECTHKVLTAQAVRQAMAQHDGLVHAYIQRQGGGDITYEGMATLRLPGTQWCTYG